MCGRGDQLRRKRLDFFKALKRVQELEKVLSAAQGSGQRFGAAHLVDIVRGTPTGKAAQFGHDRRPVFGTGADRDKNGWRSIVRQMVATGFLRLDIAGYSGIGISDKGRALLHGKGEFLYREDTVIARGPVREPRARSARAPERALDGGDAALLAGLKALRLELAKARGVPALYGVSRSYPGRHGAPASAHRGGFCRGQRGRYSEAQAVRRALPRRHQRHAVRCRERRFARVRGVAMAGYGLRCGGEETDAWRAGNLGMHVGSEIGYAAHSPEMEIEAEQFAMYVMSYANMRVDAARDIIVRLHGGAAPTAIRSGEGWAGYFTTHPPNDYRLAAQQATLRRIRAGHTRLPLGSR